MWMGIVGFDVERLRELAIQLSDEKLFILYHIYNFEGDIYSPTHYL